MNYITNDKLNNCFLKNAERNDGLVYFCQVCGQDNDILLFLNKFYTAALQNGCYITEAIKNPSEQEVNSFYNTVGVFDSVGENLNQVIEVLFSDLNNGAVKRLKSAFIWQINEMSAGMSGGVLKNAAIKLLCWLKYRFGDIIASVSLPAEAPKLLYEAPIGKYEAALLNILAVLGIDVIFVDFEAKTDIKRYVGLSGVCIINGSEKMPPRIHFTDSYWKNLNFRKNLESKASDGKLTTNYAVKDNPFDLSLKTGAAREINGGKCFNLFVRCDGVKEDYEQQLFEWRLEIEKQGRKFVLIDGRLENPKTEEISTLKTGSFNSVDEMIPTLISNIDIGTMSTAFEKAFADMLDSGRNEQVGKLKNKAVCTLCWLKRYADIFQNYDRLSPAVFVFNGVCNKNEAFFLEFISKLPIDVFNICTDLNAENSLESEYLHIIRYNDSAQIKPFPINPSKLAAGTVAYRAQREIEEVLYSDSDSVLFKNRQFRDSLPLTLKTTFEEIDILWNQEAKYRPHFDVRDNTVIVPTIFAKICGVMDGGRQEYYKHIRSKLTQDTIVYKTAPFMMYKVDDSYNRHSVGFIRDGVLQVEHIKSSPVYKYSYLSENVQNYIINKIQKLIDLDWIKSSSHNVPTVITAALLNLDKETLRLIQKFDFTKEIPKLIIINTRESVCSIENCIYIAFLNLIGFDILLYVPTGYNLIENYIKSGIFSEHQIGAYDFDISVTGIKLKADNKAGLFDKLFGR